MNASPTGAIEQTTYIDPGRDAVNGFAQPIGGFTSGFEVGVTDGVPNFGAKATDNPRYRGSVKHLNKDKGWGHIESDQSKAIYGKDVFVLVGAFPLGREPNIGDEVEFSVSLNQKGPQALDVSFLKGEAPAPVLADASLGRFLGCIKTFDMVKGWGHIECREARAIFGKDIFMLRSAVRGAELAPGNQVEFAVTMGPKGPQARDVCLVDYGPSLADAAHYRAAPF
mmetsp:Transcript_15419/g.24421  ORF Transcript_15419/g.24421 Transcript_15419/m.24421 type:complete len:225 (+) Transcript_15419:53-727(+)